MPTVIDYDRRQRELLQELAFAQEPSYPLNSDTILHQAKNIISMWLDAGGGTPDDRADLMRFITRLAAIAEEDAVALALDEYACQEESPHG
tara:strand:+ start:81 stop:353 length:273 start_codon:yes stop_codon:yes gene_type:complete